MTKPYTVVAIWADIDFDEDRPYWNRLYVEKFEFDMEEEVGRRRREALKALADAAIRGVWEADNHILSDDCPCPPFEILAVFPGHHTSLV